jgi:hypothetical protein
VFNTVWLKVKLKLFRFGLFTICRVTKQLNNDCFYVVNDYKTKELKTLTNNYKKWN